MKESKEFKDYIKALEELARIQELLFSKVNVLLDTAINQQELMCKLNEQQRTIINILNK